MSRLPARPLKVALVHSYYSSEQPSGENTQVDAEHAALRRANVDARLFAAHTDELERGGFYRLRAATRVATGRGRSPISDLAAFAPDVVHVHNLFPNFGRNWVAELRTPVVATLHNFRAVCAEGNLFRDGRLCTDCPDGRPWSALRHRCYRGSLAATVPLALAQRRGPAADPVLARADRILCLSSRQHNLLGDAGVDRSRLTTWTNFLPDALSPDPVSEVPSGPDGGAALFVGRLTPEKGCLDMVQTWLPATPLRIVGDGPQAAEVRASASDRPVEITDRLPRTEILRLMQTSGVLVMPSGCPEGLPLVFLEALACGLPIVVRRACDVAEHVERAGLGTVVDRLDEMAPAAAELMSSDRRAITGERCRREFESLFTEAAWVHRTLDLYASLVGTKRPSRSGSGS